MHRISSSRTVDTKGDEEIRGKEEEGMPLLETAAS